jgi:hypothetical protein
LAVRKINQDVVGERFREEQCSLLTARRAEVEALAFDIALRQVDAKHGPAGGFGARSQQGGTVAFGNRAAGNARRPATPNIQRSAEKGAKRTLFSGTDGEHAAGPS